MINILSIARIAILPLVATLTACDSSDDAVTKTELNWSACDGNPQLQCTTVEVPMIHSEPDGEKITIALNRIASGGANPVGSLLFNPGGPGGSGLELIESIQEENIVPNSIRSAFHLVGFDPRGIGQSTPIDCDEFGVDDIEDYPQDIDDLRSIETDLTAFAEACHNKYGPYLQHTGSRAVVRDMDLIRSALNENTLNFIGYSYGTRLAGLYVQDYPDRVGRIILDASLPPTHSVPTLFGAELPVLEANLLTLSQSCQSFSDCDPQQYKQRLETRIQTLIENESELELGLLADLLIGAVQSPGFIPVIAETLYNYSLEWDASVLLQIADALGNDDDDEDSATMQYAVICADDPQRPSVEEIEALRATFNADSDIFAELHLAGAASCMSWPEALDPLPEISTTQAPETLVIGGPTDSQTILVWSQQMASAIGGRFLRSEHEGHTVVFADRNQCTDTAAINYLLNGELPADTVCPADSDTP